jgi:hypothetical protein
MLITKSHLAVLLLGILTKLSFATPVEKRWGPDDVLAATALSNVQKILAGTLSDGSVHASTCNSNTVIQRKE